jgi:lysophospholipase L1-like esterase
VAVSEQTPVNSSTGNGVTTVFPYTFKILSSADIEVTVDGVVKTLTTHYTLSGVGDDAGGDVTFLVAPANLTTVIRRRNMALVRTTDYQAQGELPADVLNDDQDAPVLMLQQVQEQVDRSFKIPLGESTTTTLPSAANRAEKALIFDASGNVTVGTREDLNDIDASVAAAAASAAASAASAGAAATSAGAAQTAETNAETAETNAETAEVAAELAQSLAEAARDSAFTNADVYADTAAGLAAVASGVQFSVVSTDGDELIRYLDNAGVAEEKARTPTSQYVRTARTDLAAAVRIAEDDYVSTTYGSTNPNTTTMPTGVTYGNRVPVAESGVLTSVSVRLSASGTGEIHIYAPSGTLQKYEVVKIIPVTASAAGINTWNLNVPVLKDSHIHYSRLTGGTPRYEAGAGAIVASIGQVLGDTVFIDKTYTNSLAISYTVKVAPSLAEEVEELGERTSIALGFDATTTTTTSYGDLTGTTNVGMPGSVILCAPATPAFGLVNSVTIITAAAGGCSLCFFEPSGASYELTRVLSFGQVIAGETTFDLTPYSILLPEGSYIGLENSTLATPVRLLFKAGSSVYFTATDFNGTVGATGSPVAYTNIGAIAYSFTTHASQVDARITAIEADIAALTATPPVHSTSLVHQRFAGVSFPAGWSNAGTWTVNEGLISPAVGGWGVHALSAGDSSIAKRRFTARVQVNDITSVFGICATGTEASGGAVAMIDGGAGFMRFYSWDGTAVAGTYDTQVALPAALVVGRWYTLEAEKDGLSTTLTFTDTVTQASCTLTETQNADYRQWHGRAGMLFLSGSIKVDSFDVDAMYQETLRAIIISDSIGEGNYLPANSPTWAFQLASARLVEADIMVATRAGDETPSFVARKVHDLTPWSPRYVVLGLGSNDTSQATWRTNMATTIAEVEALGAEPILMTFIPRTADQARITLQNADIRANYFGRYRYIDMAYAVSASNDGVTWNAAYNSGDNVHPNYAGQVQMYEQALADAPFLVR